MHGFCCILIVIKDPNMKIQIPTVDAGIFPDQHTFTTKDAIIHAIDQLGEINSILFSVGTHQIILDHTDFIKGIPNEFILHVEQVSMLTIVVVYKNTSVQVEKKDLTNSSSAILHIQFTYPVSKAI